MKAFPITNQCHEKPLTSKLCFITLLYIKGNKMCLQGICGLVMIVEDWAFGLQIVSDGLDAILVEKMNYYQLHATYESKYVCSSIQTFLAP